MPVSEEVVRLILETTGPEGLKLLSTAAEDLEEELQKTARQWKNGEIDVANYMRTTTRLQSQLGDVKSVLAGTNDATDNAASSTHRVVEATEKLGKTSANTGQSLLQTGRVIQDFAQGGLGGILNNIEGLTMALGLGSGLAGVLTVVGVAALTAGPSIKSYFRSLIDGSNEIPTSSDKLKALGESLKHTTERLEELGKQQRLTNADLVEFNRLTIERTRLEREEEAARAQKANAATLSADQRKGADVVKRALDAFGGKRVENEVAKALEATGNGAGDPLQGARNLLFNVQRGDVQAHEFLRDVMARGSGFTDIAGVLTGGKTPAEAQALRGRLAERQAKEAGEGQAKDQKEKEETKKLEEEHEEFADELDKKVADAARAKRIREDQANIHADNARQRKQEHQRQAHGLKITPEDRQRFAEEDAAARARRQQEAANGFGTRFMPKPRARPLPRRQAFGGRPAALNKPLARFRPKDGPAPGTDARKDFASSVDRLNNAADMHADRYNSSRKQFADAVARENAAAAKRRADTQQAINRGERKPATPSGPTPEQERSGPTAALMGIVGENIRQVGAQNATIAMAIQQLKQAQSQNASAIVRNRSASTSGLPV